MLIRYLISEVVVLSPDSSGARQCAKIALTQFSDHNFANSVSNILHLNSNSNAATPWGSLSLRRIIIIKTFANSFTLYAVCWENSHTERERSTIIVGNTVPPRPARTNYMRKAFVAFPLIKTMHSTTHRLLLRIVGATGYPRIPLRPKRAHRRTHMHTHTPAHTHRTHRTSAGPVYVPPLSSQNSCRLFPNRSITMQLWVQ